MAATCLDVFIFQPPGLNGLVSIDIKSQRTIGSHEAMAGAIIVMIVIATSTYRSSGWQSCFPMR